MTSTSTALIGCVAWAAIGPIGAVENLMNLVNDPVVTSFFSQADQTLLAPLAGARELVEANSTMDDDICRRGRREDA